MMKSSHGIRCLVFLVVAVVGLTSPVVWASTARTDVTIIIDKSAPLGGTVNISVDTPAQITVSPKGFWDETAGLHPLAFRYRRNEWESSWIAGDFVDSDLQPNTLYTYQIKARDAVRNETPYLSPVSKYTLALDPIGVIIERRTENSVTLSINGHPANGTPPEYQLELRHEATGTVGVMPFSTKITQRSIVGLSPATEYEVWVTTRNGDGVINKPVKMIDRILTNEPQPPRGHDADSVEAVPVAVQVERAILSAEALPDEIHLEIARQAIARLPDGPDRESVERRLKNVEALAAVMKVESQRTEANLRFAAEQLRQLPDGPVKQALSDRLVGVRIVMALDDATRQPPLPAVPVSGIPFYWFAYLVNRLGSYM